MDSLPPPVQIPNPPVPLTLHTKPQIGRLYSIDGATSVSTKSFSVNFYIQGPNGHCAIHLDHRFNEGQLVRNSFRRTVWETEERQGGPLPIAPGQSFQILLLFEEARLMIAYNGVHFTEFVHRMPIAAIDTLTIVGEVRVSMYQESQTDLSIPPQFLRPRPPLKMAGKDANGLSVYILPGGLAPGRKIHINGNPGAGDVYINLQPNPQTPEVGFHVAGRVGHGVVAFNSRIGDTWQQEVHPPSLKLVKGQHFNLEISATEEAFWVVQNGSTRASLPVRHIRPFALNALLIGGDVKIAYVTF